MKTAAYTPFRPSERNRQFIELYQKIAQTKGCHKSSPSEYLLELSQTKHNLLRPK